MSRALSRFPFVRFVFVVLIIGLWLRSRRESDLLALFLHHGQVQLLGTDQGRVIVAISNIEFGKERAFTLEHIGVADDQFSDIRTLLYETTPLPKKILGTYLGGSPVDPFGLKGAHYTYWIVSLIYPGALAALWLLLGLRTFWLRRKWGTGSICGHCGYDARASNDRCPECGTVLIGKT